MIKTWLPACAAILAALVIGATSALAAENEEGRIVRVSPDVQSESDIMIDKDGKAVPAVPQVAAASPYWIGVIGGELSAELKAHLGLKGGEGILVREVVPGSPAEKAGLKTFDILLTANEKELRGMGDLVQLVHEAGAAEQAISIAVIREGRKESASLTPEKRPADAVLQRVPFPGGMAPGEFGPNQADVQAFVQQQMEQLRANPQGQPFNFRVFGPGMMGGAGVGGGGGVKMPNGVSVSVSKQNDEPAQVTVRRGEEEWMIKGDDPEALEALPADLRPFVEQMLQSTGDKNVMLRMVPAPQLRLNPGTPNVILDGKRLDGDLKARLDQMEQQMEELQKKLSEDLDAEAKK